MSFPNIYPPNSVNKFSRMILKRQEVLGMRGGRSGIAKNVFSNVVLHLGLLYKLKQVFPSTYFLILLGGQILQGEWGWKVLLLLRCWSVCPPG